MNNLQLIPMCSEFEQITNVESFENIKAESIIQFFLRDLKNDNTRKQYERAVRNWFVFLSTVKNINYITLKDLKVNYSLVQAYMRNDNKLLEDEKIKSSTYNAKIKGCRKFYEWLIKQTTVIEQDYSYIKYNPFDGVEMVEEKDAKGSEALTPEEIMLMLNHPYGNDPHIRERNMLIFLIALTTGLREDTLINLKEYEIMQVSGCFVIDKLTKGRKLTEKPITDYYERLMNWYNADKVCRAKDYGTIFNIRGITANEMIKNWVKSVGINKKVTFHGLRATCGILVYYANGNNAYGVKEFLDHSDIETTERYLKKENSIDHSGENAMKKLQSASSTISELDRFSKEDIIKAIGQMNLNTQIDLMEILKRGA